MADSDEDVKVHKSKHKKHHHHRKHKSEKRSANSDSDDEIPRKKKKKKEKKERRHKDRNETKVCDIPMPKSDKSPPRRGDYRKGEDNTSDLNEVHSANAWEKVDMGSDERKEKFLRLMGASRNAGPGTSHTDADKQVHSAAGQNTKTISADLERQYRAGLDQRYRRYGGLGSSSADGIYSGQTLGEANDPSSSSIAEMKKKYSTMFVKGSNTR